jgi:multiple sugar transport system permease protein
MLTKGGSFCRHKKLISKRKHKILLLFLAPSLVFFTLFYYAPIIYGLVMSFYQWKIIGIPSYVGLQNYRQVLFNSTAFTTAFRNTVVFTFWFVILNVSFSLFIAVNLDVLPKALRDLTRVVCFLPVVASMVGMSLVWKWLLDPSYGLINQLLGLIRLGPYGWLKSIDMAMGSVIAASVWKQSGFYTIVFVAGLQTIPSVYYESAVIDGASSARRFWHITVPLLRPIIALQLIMATITGFKTFTQIFVLTKGGPGNSTMTTSMYIYRTGFMNLQMGRASAAALLVSVLLIVLSIVQYRMTSRAY